MFSLYSAYMGHRRHYIPYCSVFHQHYLLTVWTSVFCCQRDGTCTRPPTENRKLICHRAPTAIRQIYVDIPSINGWKIDGIWCPWVEHEAAGGTVDTSAIFGRSPDLSFNLEGQPTDALLHALGWSGKMKGRRACHRNVSVSVCVCVKSLLTCIWHLCLTIKHHISSIYLN